MRAEFDKGLEQERAVMRRRFDERQQLDRLLTTFGPAELTA